jgi:predicted RecA/RadA family phage recombinase
MAQEIELRSGNYKEIRVTIAGAAVSKGEFAIYNDICGFYLQDAAIGDDVILIVEAENAKVAKEASLAINAGDAVYFDTTANEADKTDTNHLIGYCREAALAADTHVKIIFDGKAYFEQYTAPAG